MRFIILTTCTEKYHRSSPTPLDNLLRVYGLESITKSIARTNPDGSKGVKLRKSYKNHIQDLPGKHHIPAGKLVPMALLDPLIGQHSDIVKPLSPNLLDQALRFEKTSLNGIPGFDTADLAISDQLVLMRGDDMSETDEFGVKKSKRKKKAQTNGGALKRQHL